jgi:hypothetical protein
MWSYDYLKWWTCGFGGGYWRTVVTHRNVGAMSTGGGHRSHSVARLLAAPLLLAVAALVGFAVYRGQVVLLQVTAVMALAIGVLAVILFDRELVNARRDHGADRASLARSYMTMYAARVREQVQATSGVTLPLTAEELAEAEKPPAEVEDADGVVTPLPVAVDVGAVAGQTETPELWENLRDAPTVVDLIAFEERAKLAELIAAAEAADQAKAEETA